MESNFANTINYFGRNVVGSDKVQFFNSCSGFAVSFVGTQLFAKISFTLLDNTQQIAGKIRVYVDDDKVGNVISCDSQDVTDVLLCDNLPQATHKVVVKKCNSSHYNVLNLFDIFGGQLVPFVMGSKCKLEFYGDSLTAGFDVLNSGCDCVASEDGTISYAGLTATALNAQANIVCRSGIAMSSDCWGCEVLAHNTYDYYCFDKHHDLGKWDFAKFVADVVIINIGTNDSSKFEQLNDDEIVIHSQQLFDNYRNVVDSLLQRYQNATIVCTLGMAYTHKDVLDTIKKVVRSFDDARVKFLQFTQVQYGKSDHPTQLGQQDACNQLLDFLNNNVFSKN